MRLLAVGQHCTLHDWPSSSTTQGSELAMPNPSTERVWSGSWASPFVQAIRIGIRGMHCSACSTAVETALMAMKGVQHASVSLSLQQAELTYDAALVSEASPG